MLTIQDEFSEAEDNLRATVDLIDTEMTTIETNIAKIGAVTDLSKAVLEQYASIDKELKTLRAANDNFVETKKLSETAKAYEESLNNLVREQISFMQQAINAEMVIINNAIYIVLQDVKTVF